MWLIKNDKLGDILHYRIPNKNSVSSKGAFIKVNSILDVSGFFVSDFKKENTFVFESTNSTPSFSYSKLIIQEQTRVDYLKTGKDFLSEVTNKGLDKVILSRVKLIDHNVNLFKLYKALCDKYQSAFVYLISSEIFGTWIGATPEVLICRENSNTRTMSLAGTLPTNSNKPWSYKEIDEQEYVTKFIHGELLKLDIGEIKKSNLNTVQAGPVKHLRTDFEFNLTEDKVLKLASLLHPTPAVSGFPREDAILLINKFEKHSRQFYSGLIGVHNARKSDVFVNLRCAQVFDKSIALYLGGGYTKDSSVEAEWDETEVKAATLLEVIKMLEE